MAAMGCEEQSEAQAESVKGEETAAPLPGLLTLTPANAGLASRASANPPAHNVLNVFMKRTPAFR